jgi:hypothetical protein
MAVQLPSPESVPLVTPQAAGGVPSFGGAEAATQELAGAVSGLGEGLTKQADFIQSLRNENNARDASVQLNAQMGAITSAYLQKQGKAADDGYDDYTAQLQAARSSAVSAMPNLEAGKMLGDQAAYMVDRFQQEGVRHRGEAMTQWTRQSYVGKLADAATTAAQNWGNPELVGGQVAVGQDAAKSLFAIDGGDPSSPDGAATLRSDIAGATDKVVVPAVRVAAASNPAAAQALVDKYGPSMSAAGLEEVTRELHVSASNAQGVSVAQQELARAAQPGGGVAPSNATPDQLNAAFEGQEGTGTSVQGAVAGLMPGTFKQFAQPGEDINNPTDNAVVRQRIIAKYSSDYPGDPARVAVALFSGPGNVAPPDSPVPWLRDPKDGNGTSTSQYVSGFLGRLTPGQPAAATPAEGTPAAGTPATGTPAPPSRSDILMRTIQATAGNPLAQEAAVRHLDMVFRAQDADRVDAEHGYQVQQQVAKAASESDETKVLGALGSNPASVTARDILNPAGPYPHLLPAARENMVAFVERQTKPDPAAAVSAATVQGLVSDVRAGKITDMGPVYDAFTSGRMNRAGFDFVQQQFKDLQTDAGQRLDQEQSKFLAAVRPSIDKSNPLMGSLDMSGGVNFFRLQQDIAKDIDDYRKAGKNPHDLFDPSKPDYLGKPEALEPYQNSIVESMDDISRRMHTGKYAPAAQPASPSPPPATRTPDRTVDEGFGPALVQGGPVTALPPLPPLPPIPRRH